jgi:hypothetical protein
VLTREGKMENIIILRREKNKMRKFLSDGNTQPIPPDAALSG